MTSLAEKKLHDRLHIQYLSPQGSSLLNDGQDVIEGLTQSPKTLPAKYFYDDVGSQLFEKICTLPEYYPTRTEAWILKEYADAIANITSVSQLVELGSGSSTKTRLLLDAYQRKGVQIHYQPIDVSAGILIESAETLLRDYPNLKITAKAGTYEQALLDSSSQINAPKMVFFLGSSLGNFSEIECDQFFFTTHCLASPQ